MPDWQYGVGEDLGSWVQKFLSMYNPGEQYGGQLTAKNPTSYESMGLDQLGGLLKQPATGDLFNAAKGNVMDTLAGKFSDPNTSPFIQAFQKLAGQNLQDQITTERGQRGARGTYFTKAGVDAESKLGERTQNTLNSLIQEFINNERGRQQTAVGQAKDLEGYATDSAIKRISASQTLGSLPRILEQADLENQYNAWLNQRGELSKVPGAAQSLFNTNIPTVTTTSAPRSQTSGQDVAPWIKLAMQYGPQLMSMMK
jgi:hypothetical protein